MGRFQLLENQQALPYLEELATLEKPQTIRKALKWSYSVELLDQMSNLI